MIFSPFGIDRPPFEIPFLDLLISLISTLLLSDLDFHLTSCPLSRFYFLTLSLEIGYFILKPVAESE